MPARTAVLRHRSYRLLFTGQSISSLGDRIVPVALAFAVLDLTRSATDLGIVLAAQTVPLTVFVLVGGVWADRLERRAVMLASDAARCVAQAVSAALLLSGNASVAELAALQAVYGIAAAFFGPASLALVPETVPAEQMQEANALIGISQNLSAVVGPAVAGTIVAVLTPGWGLALDAVTFAGSAVCLRAMPRIDVPPRVRETMLHELRAGWRAFRSRSWLLITVVCFTAFMGLCYAPWQVLGPVQARHALGGAGAWAAISVGTGVGALLGGVLALRLRPRHPLRVAMGLLAVSTPAVTALLAAAAPLWTIVPVAVLDGIAISLFNTFWFTALQADVPAEELARVSSWDYLGSLVILPLGQALAGPVAAVLGLAATLYGAAALGFVLFAASLLARSVRDFSPPARGAGGLVADAALGPPPDPALSGGR